MHLLSIGLAGTLALTAVGALPASAAPTSIDTERPAITPLTRQEAKTRPVLRRGDSGVWVRRLHRALRVTPTKQPFGARTARAVREFRAAHGLPARPVVSVRTWIALGSLVEVPAKQQPPAPATPVSPSPTSDRPVLQQGDTSGWVQAVQIALGVQPPSGYFGPLTLAAVRTFQQSAGIPVTGVVDAATWAALGTRVTPPQIDVTTTDAARTSRSHRASLGVTQFVSSWTAQLVVKRESGGNCAIVNPTGKYRGKWQMDADFWSTYGGLEFAERPDLATCAEQDLVAYRGWVDRWWQPWPTAIP